MSNKVLILGGSYFIGRKIALTLCENGYEVSILNRGMKQTPSENIEQIICDRNNKENMKNVLHNKKFDYIIDVSWQDIEWVKILCEAVCMDYVKSFVFISSSAVYDVEHLEIPYCEYDTLAENKYWTYYGKGKIEAERYYQDYFQNKDTKLIILRPPYVYGEFNYVQRESFIFKYIMEEKEIIIPKSNPKLQFIYSGDLAGIIHHLFHHNREKVSIYNVGNKSELTAKEWIQTCSKIIGKYAIIIEYDYKAKGKNIRDFFPFFDYDNVLDVTKINSVYKDETSFEVGLNIAYEWYKQNAEQIIFKENVEQNIYEIILELNK